MNGMCLQTNAIDRANGCINSFDSFPPSFPFYNAVKGEKPISAIITPDRQLPLDPTEGDENISEGK